MAVANVGSGTAFVGATGNASLTTFTVGSGSNLALFAAILFDSNPSAVTVTWHGVALTFDSQDSFTQVQFWRLVNPDVGNFTLQVNWTPAGSSQIIVGAVAFSGVDQTTPTVVADATNSTATGTNASITVTSSTDGATIA